MAEKDPASIADSSKPNAGRIYDYLLGGNHNFEVDRLAAQQIATISPNMGQFARLVRWFLGEAVRRLVADGFRSFVDFASGLPTVDHIHQVAPQGSKVIYSDIDPITVAYGQEIVKANPLVRYVLGDCGRAEDVLGSPLVEDLFGSNRKVAIGYSGVAYFMPDEAIAHSLKVLYDWADKGSRLFYSDFDSTGKTEEVAKMMKLYEKLGQPGYPRTMAKLKEMLGSWKVTAPGFLPLEQWVGIEKTTELATQSSLGGYLQGVILEK
jgi:O-methyltransferase involved in polyketide biosynthesis